ncbi:PAS domain S-box protein [Gemmata sp. JC673]|uniref:histidine kinase n=1 Tax=Gemmata algarum TaxID=2975278 RepID=A0ABU5EYV1_9BACT|nr:PAS domain S-box protein [Gemmata algarum]MDY3560341.1 PAS domain S-box protein [Gemmata algarum]
MPVAVLLLCAMPLVGEPPRPALVTARSVRALDPVDAARGHPVDLTGVITVSSTSPPELFVQDDTSGVYVEIGQLREGLEPGTRVRVRGRSRGGWFSPLVVAESVERLGPGRLPDPLPFDFSQPSARWLESQFVQSYCLVRGVMAGGGGLEVDGTAGPGTLAFRTPPAAPDLRALVGTIVRVRGVCIPEYGPGGRVTGGVRVLVHRLGDIQVAQSLENVRSMPVRTVAYLRRFLPGVSPIPLVRMSGVVTARIGPGAFLVQDVTGGFTVYTRPGTVPIAAGAIVDVRGFLTWSGSRLTVHQAEVTPNGDGPLPDSVDLTPASDRATLEGARARFQGRVTESGSGRLTLARDGLTVLVRLPDDDGRVVSVGSLVSATGALDSRDATGAVLFPVGAGDVTVDAPPPARPLTRAQVVAALGLALGAVAACAAWAWSLHRAVRFRTRELSESERKFAAAFHANPDAVVLTRAGDGTLLEVNEGFCRLYGLSREQVLGRSTVELTWRDSHERALMIETVRATGALRDYPGVIRDAAGQRHEVSIFCTRIEIGGGECLLGTIRDVTERNRAEREARNERLFVDTMIESMPGVLYFYDANGKFLRWNRRFETVTGYSAAEIAVMHPLDFFAPADHPLLSRRIGDVFATGEAHVEAPLLAKDGTARQYYFTGRRVMFEGAPCLVGIGIDVTARHEAERQRADSERRYRELVELANSIILRWTPDGRVAFLNEFGQRFFGFAAEEIVGRHVMDTIVPQTEITGRDLKGLIERVCADPGAFEQSVNENVRRDGTRAWVAWTNRVVLGAGGEVVEILSVGSDVTGARRMEHALVASEKKFSAVFRLSPVSLALTRLDGPIVDVNKSFERIYKLSAERVRGRPPTDFAELYDAPADRAMYAERLRRDGRLSGIEVRRALADGSAVDLVVAAELIELDGVAHALVASTDVTPLKRAEKALREANAALERRVGERTNELVAANAELEAFCYSVSHDLRAPLRAVDGFSQALLEDYGPRLDAEAHGFLKRIRGAAARMGELIDDLLTLSRVTRADLRRERVDLSDLAGEVVRALRQTDPGRAVEVVIAPELFAEGDRSLLRVVLENLLGNAWKYTSKVAAPRVELGREERTEGPTFFVRDNGAGFDPAYAHKLFQPFQRLHREAEFPGHGVGLATVLRVVRRHGGAVGAEGSVGNGARFWFTMPEHHPGPHHE